MNTPKALLIGFAMVAVAVYFSRDVGPAQAAIGLSNYSITGDANGNQFWLVDNINKTITNCQGEKWTETITIECSPWQSIDKLKIFRR